MEPSRTPRTPTRATCREDEEAHMKVTNVAANYWGRPTPAGAITAAELTSMSRFAAGGGLDRPPNGRHCSVARLVLSLPSINLILIIGSIFMTSLVGCVLPVRPQFEDPPADE